MAKQKNPRLTSPKGTFKYPRLAGEPDFRFDKECGAYSVKLLLDPNAKGVQEFLTRLDEETDKAVAEMKEQNPKHAKKIVVAKAYKMEEDEDGNETGKVEIGFSMKARVTAKQGKNAGKTFEFKPVLFDSFGKPIADEKIRIGGGTVGKISFEFFPYFAANDKRAGISKRLLAAQIIELVEWTGGGNAAAFGFDDEDEGFSSSTTSTTTTATDDDEDDDDDASETTDGADF